MAVCQFFLQGRCRFGNQCRNEHPVNARSNATSFGQPGGWPALGGGASSSPAEPDIALTRDGIASDLGAHGRPLWHLTSYAPARGEPNLVGGLDISPEEDRWMAYQARQAGQEALYVRCCADTDSTCPDEME